MALFKKILIVLLFLLLLLLGLALHYYLPRTEKVTVVGTEVKWTDDTKLRTAQDIRYIFTKKYNSHEALVFRNEDMPWPPYFKFDSGDLSGKAMALQKTTPEPVALVTFYGWRIHVLSMYPNATHLEVVSADYEAFPWFNVIFLNSLGLFLIFAWFRIRAWVKKWRARGENDAKLTTATPVKTENHG